MNKVDVLLEEHRSEMLERMRGVAYDTALTMVKYTLCNKRSLGQELTHTENVVLDYGTVEPCELEIEMYKNLNQLDNYIKVKPASALDAQID